MSRDRDKNYYDDILSLNYLLDNTDYLINIIDNPDNLELHKNNKQKLDNIIEKYIIVYNRYIKYIHRNKFFYLYKCFYQLTMKFIINLAGFNIYLAIFLDYNKDKDNIENYIDKYIYDYVNFDIIPIKKDFYENDKSIMYKILYYEMLLNFFGLQDINYRYKNYYEIKIFDMKNIDLYFEDIKLDKNRIIYKNFSSFVNYSQEIINYIENIMKKTMYNIIYIYEYINYKNPKYISIPQYKNNCWFIATITGICYSDLNKKLLLSKDNDNSNKFKNMIYYIINNITKNFRKYNDNDIENDCELFMYLKNEPSNVLAYLIKQKYSQFIDEYKKLFKSKSKSFRSKSKSNNDFIDFLFNKYKYSKYFYFVYFIKLNKKNNKLSFDINKNNFGLPETCENIISYLYDLLNITNKFFYIDYYNDFFIRKDEDNETIPEIIIVNYDNTIEFDSSLHNYNNDISINNDSLKYLGHEYKLDYILHNDNYDYPCTINKCGHCISAITYNNNQYIHDSEQYMHFIKCGEEKINIPCFLIKQDWNKNIKKQIDYCISECEYNIECKINKEYQKDLCFSFDKFITYIYVKK